ncbi:MAG: HAMP domain-containing histidine kinase [Synergistaceae bacterium]|nr:HAMP domain-containing histidine kinase [Synergistaceae bacterium]
MEITRAAMEQKALSIAESRSSFGAGGKGGYGADMRFLDELAMAEVWIVDENLMITSRGQGNHFIRYEDLPENAEEMVREVFSGEITYSEEFSGILGVSALTLGAPIIFDEDIVGAVLLHSPVSGITSAVTQGLGTVILACLAALFVSGILAALLSYLYTKPLLKMKNMALSLIDGDYSVHTGLVSEEEIGQLASVLDTLSQRLQEVESQRENLDKMRESFVANVSHELRTPVAVLRGSLELLQDGLVNNPEEIGEYYQQMLLESRHLERLVNDLLELSRLQDIGFYLRMEEVNLCDVVNDAVRAMRPAAQKKHLSFDLAMPSTECIISGDYDRIRQLLVILLDNAIKFSKDGGLVGVDLNCPNDFILTVVDHGEGILEKDIPFIFDRFHKNDDKSNKIGTGLGLAIASEIVKRHGANISVQSDEEATVFKVVFPRVIDEKIKI